MGGVRSNSHKNAAKQQCSIKASSDNTLVIKKRCASIPSLFIWNSLTKLVLCPNDKEEKTVAAGLKAFLENFSTVILIVFQCKVHNIINPVSQLLQKEDEDISNASAMLNRAIDMMKALRCSFDEVHEKAV